MVRSNYLPLAVAGLLGLAQAATPDEWMSRSIYQVITDRFARTNLSETDCNLDLYCGGTWAGLTDKLDYIADMGFTAIQISPVQQNLPNNTIYGEAFHGYWPQSLYSLNENFGTEDDLKNLITAVHNRSMYILVDVVGNEFAYDIGNTTMTSSTYIDYDVFDPFSTSSDYDPYCPIDNWDNVTQYQTCWLGYEGVATPHFNLSETAVVNTLTGWIADFVKNYSIDGIRVDGAKQMILPFIGDFTGNASVYSMSEVDDSDAANVCDYQNLTAGLENYPTYYAIIQAFTAGNMSGLVDMVSTMNSDCASPQYLANFIENQDNERFASYTEDMALDKNAIGFTILADGIPKIYYGQEQHFTGVSSPDNRQPIWTSGYNTSAELYQYITKLNKIRNHAINVNSNYVTNTSILLYSDNSTYATRKGPNGVQVVTVLSNQGTSGGEYELSVPGAADEGTNMTEVLGCTTVLAGSNGTIVVDMGAGAPKVFFPTFNLNGSGLCGTTEVSTTVGSNSSSTSSSSSSTSSSSKKSAAESLNVPVWFSLGFAGVFSLMFLL